MTLGHLFLSANVCVSVTFVYIRVCRRELSCELCVCMSSIEFCLCLYVTHANRYVSVCVYDKH
jgi:hypothetical protein